MAQDDLFGAPAGWYPDPMGLPQLRWWNNHAWTEQTSAARQPMVMQDTKFAWADDELPTRREERERERARDDREPIANTPPTAETLRELEPPRAFTKIDEPDLAPQAAAAEPTIAPAQATAAAAASPTVESFYQPDPIVESSVPSVPSFGSLFDFAPATVVGAPIEEDSLNALFGARSERRGSSTFATPLIQAETIVGGATAASDVIVSTGPAWIIAMVPLFQLVLSLLLLTAFGMGNNLAVFVGILVVPYFLVIGLAILDYRMLKKGGSSQPAHWTSSFLGAPVYLLLRARSVIRQTGHGIGPVLVWFALALMHVASVVAIPGLLISLMPAVFSAQIEQSVERDALLISGTQMAVTCPDTPPLLIAEQVECSAISSNGNQFNIMVSLERANGWIAWQVVDWGVFQMERSN